MPIAVDATTPALVSGTSSTQTTAAFSPPASTLLVACVAFEAAGNAGATITLSNTGTGLTWTQRARRDGNDSGGNTGIAAIYTAPNNGSQAGITVSAVSSVGSDAGGLKLFVVTGANLGSPVGASGEGSSTDSDITPNVYVSTVANSRAFGMFSDDSAEGSNTSTDTGFDFMVFGRLGGLAVHKAADTAVAGSTVTLNCNNGEGFSEFNWVAVEIKPFVPTLPQRPLLLGQAVNRAATY